MFFIWYFARMRAASAASRDDRARAARRARARARGLGASRASASPSRPCRARGPVGQHEADRVAACGRRSARRRSTSRSSCWPGCRPSCRRRSRPDRGRSCGRSGRRRWLTRAADHARLDAHAAALVLAPRVRASGARPRPGCRRSPPGPDRLVPAARNVSGTRCPRAKRNSACTSAIVVGNTTTRGTRRYTLASLAQAMRSIQRARTRSAGEDRAQLVGEFHGVLLVAGKYGDSYRSFGDSYRNSRRVSVAVTETPVFPYSGVP